MSQSSAVADSAVRESVCVEVNFDGLIGPTHHYGGLSPGNVASESHRLQKSYPRRAARQGLDKMQRLMDLGLKQGILPPHPRPDWGFLRQQGLTGTHEQILQQARARLDLLSIASSASAMWAANAATVSPAVDTADGRVHFTPANLISTPHRQLEPAFTTRLLRRIFHDESRFVVHEPLPTEANWADEGAANHSRLCTTHAAAGVELFVFGRDHEHPLPQRFPARQTRAASERIAAQHQLDPERVVFARQNPAAIDAGVFHNDVIAVANEQLLLVHERAFAEQATVLDELRAKFPALRLCEIPEALLSLDEAIGSYLFNSQLLTLPQGTLLLCPEECAVQPAAQRALALIRQQLPEISQVQFVDVRQSMENGGGPACLRLRVVLSEADLQLIPESFILTDARYRQLAAWIDRHYREELTLADLADPKLPLEVAAALAELTEILELGDLYDHAEWHC